RLSETQVPVAEQFQTIAERDSRLEAQHLAGTGAIRAEAQHVARSRLYVLHRSEVLAACGRHFPGQLVDADLPAAADVDGLADGIFREPSKQDTACGVAHESEVARLASI